MTTEISGAAAPSRRRDAAGCRQVPYHPQHDTAAPTMAPLTLLKFSSEDCGTCHRMSHYDEVVCTELGCSFVSVMLQDTETYRRYRKVLLAQYPNKQGMGWPTYLLVSEPEGDFTIHGELRGGMPKGDFRERLAALIPA